jgi:AraC family transcriptional regulator
MAERSFAPRQGDEPPVVTRVASATFPGFSVALLRNEPAIFDTGAWPDLRLMMQTSAATIRAACQCDGRTLDYLQNLGDLIIQPPATPGVWRDYGPAEILVLNIAPRFLRQTAEGLDMDPAQAEFSPWLHARDPQVEHIALALKAGLTSGEGLQRIYAESLGVALATRLISRFGAGVAACRQGLSPNQRRRVVDYIDAHLDDDLSLHTLASVARVSVPHFTVLFRRAMGRSAHRYVVERRVAAAQALLAGGGLTIAQVALETGFAHQSHLSRCMRKITGLTPGEVLRCR